jgi:hypothetical protein
MSNTFRISLIVGVACATAVALASHAGPNPVVSSNPHLGVLVSSCATGFTQSGSTTPANGSHSFSCTARVVCPKGTTNFQSIGGTATKTGQMSETLQYTCNYQQLN